MSIEKIFSQDSNKNLVFGKFRAVVKDTADPEKLGRIKVRCDGIYGSDLSPWAWPCLPYGGENEVGIFFLPSEGSGVWIEFEQGFITNPIWTGAWSTKFKGINELPQVTLDNYGKHCIIKTKAGHSIEFFDGSGAEKIVITEGKSGIKITLASGLVTVNGDFAVGAIASLADIVATTISLKNHTHPAPGGTTGAPNT